MPYSARILADSLAPSGARLTTFEISYPRIVHAELMTHREFSRNAASSRAIPIGRLISQVENDTFVPIYWGAAQKGMVADQELEPYARERCKEIWLESARYACAQARRLADRGCHKQIPNRLLEPFQYITVIVTASNWTNFFAQRCHPAAQPEIRQIAELMADLYYAATPRTLRAGDWHLPLVNNHDRLQFPKEALIRLAVARCARVSYLTHDGRRDPEADFQLYDHLLTSGHWSPFEHVARAERFPWVRSGNIRGFTQFRKLFEAEYRQEFSWKGNDGQSGSPARSILARGTDLLTGGARRGRDYLASLVSGLKGKE